MRTIFTSQDIKNIISKTFNGNLAQYRASKGKIAYENPNSEKILLIDEDDGTKTEYDLAQYLDIRFYSWKNRLIEKGEFSRSDDPQLMTYEDWAQSLNASMKESYGLVELVDEEVTASQDIDSATKIGRITFLVQSDKISNLDYYVSKIRNAYLGNPQDIQNQYGEVIKAYIVIGTLVYEEEPSTIQLGECVQVSCNFRISYLTNALSYSDTEIAISLDGDDLYTEEGEIYGDTKYLTMPITKVTWQNIFTSNPLPTANRPDLTGFVATALSNVKTISFYDFNKELSMRFNDLFWKCSAYIVDGKPAEEMEVNIPVFVRIKSNGHTYVYKDIIDNIQKTIVNNDFNISSITLKGNAKAVTNSCGMTLSFYSEDMQTSYGEKTVYYGLPIGELPTVEVPEYHTFYGWFIDGMQITEDTVWLYSGNKSATASIQGVKYSLTLWNDHDDTQLKYVEYGESVGTLPQLFVSGLNFNNWYLDNGSGYTDEITNDTVWNYTDNKVARALYYRNDTAVEKGTNLRQKKLTLVLQVGSSTSGDTIFSFKNNTEDYIAGISGSVGIKGYGIFSNISLTTAGSTNTFTIDIPNTKDYIVDTLASSNVKTATFIGFPLLNFTVKFNTNVSASEEGTHALDPIQVELGNPVGELPTPTKKGYEFYGWQINDTAVTADTIWWNYPSSMTDFTKAFETPEEFYYTLEAVWSDPSPTQTYTLYFNSNGGSDCDPIQVTYGKKIGILPTTVKEGYTFIGWYIGTKKITDLTYWTYDSDKTAVALWQSPL